MNKLKMILSAFIFGAIIFAGTVHAQKYKTLADTANLNKEYKGLTADIADLNTKLTAAQNKAMAYQQKTAQAQQDALTAARQSKEQANAAAGGDIKQIKKELKKAKKANNEANDARDAANDEKANQKEIKYLTGQIAKKQSKLDELDKERTSITAQGGAPKM
jgi:outer membrane murein-binding lipoprotein Lpp